MPPHHHPRDGPEHDPKHDTEHEHGPDAHAEHGRPHDERAQHDDGYLFVVAYDDDAERKRAEYLFNTWDEGEIRTPDGLVRLATDVDETALYEDLLAKFRPEQVDAYALSTLDAPETAETRSIERTIAADESAVRSFLGYLLSKKKGTEKAEDEYEVYTNKGRADVSLSLAETAHETTVSVRLSGHPPVLDHLVAYLDRELDEFEASR